METVTSEDPNSTYQENVDELLSKALRALCLTQDYVGEETLPPLPGWEWYDVATRLADHIGGEWSDDLRKRRNLYVSRIVRRKFNVGDWVFGVGEHRGCSQVFQGTLCDYHPFSFLDDFDPENYRIATQDEIEQARR